MKRLMLLTLAAGILSGGALLAIPQTIGGFIAASNNPRNLTLEEWFRDAAHWAADTTLPGNWVKVTELRTPDKGIAGTGFSLRKPGAIFGIEAHEVVVDRDDKGAILSVRVFYDSDTAKVAKGDLRKRLDKAVTLFTGKDGKAAGYTVALAEPNAGAVTATFTR